MLKRVGISIKIMAPFCLLLILTIFLISVIIVKREAKSLSEMLEGKAKAILENVIQTSAPLLEGFEYEVIQANVESLRAAHRDITYLHILDLRGEGISSTDPELIGRKVEVSKDKRLLQLQAPITYGEEVIGEVLLGISLEGITREISLTRQVLFGIGSLFLLIGIIVYYFIVKGTILRPVGQFVTFLGLVSRTGNFTQRVSIKTKDETGQLAEAINKLMNTLEGIVKEVFKTADKVASFSQQLSSSTQQVNASTQEISTAIQQITKGAATQSQRVDETLEVMQRASSGLKQIMFNAQTTTTGIGQTSQRAEKGQVSAQEAVEKILRLTDTVSSTVKVIQILGESSQQISEITETITSIADQTNLLALNAAIEAARAGEAGRGFAVVAEEVRKLAEGSAEAVRKIGNLIKSIQAETSKAISSMETSSKEVREGKDMVDNIADLLVKINNSVQDASKLTSQITEATTEQVQGAERVVAAVNEVATVAKESVATAEEVSSSVQEQTASMQEMSAAAQELARLAMGLKDLVSKFIS